MFDQFLLCLNFEVYPKVKVRATEVDDYVCSVIPLQDFNSLSIRDFSPGIAPNLTTIFRIVLDLGSNTFF